jgi:23S rRNA (cytosine1962-C5)-methyltransferase
MRGFMASIVLTGRGRRRVLGGHPWIYRDDVAGGEAAFGELAPVVAPDGAALGWGLFSTASKIAVRLVSRAPEQPTRAFWAERVGRAIQARARMGLFDPEGACRLVGGDAEGLPGFVVDRYRDVLVVQSGCQGSDRMRDFLLELVRAALVDVGAGSIGAEHVYERSDSGVRKLEALEPRTGWLAGGVDGPLEVVEREPGAPELVYEVDVAHGHKTGHYLDQRTNRARAAELVPAEGSVLDAFCYDGLFGIRAALAGARDVVCLDQSEAAGERALRNAERNGVADRVRFEKANAMVDLRRRAVEGERYDLVVVDPPAFARNKREAEGAARGYRELFVRALGLSADAGWVVGCSCSYNFRLQELLALVGEASRDAARDAWIVETRGAAPDHPVLATLPESSYLKCVVLRT